MVSPVDVQNPDVLYAEAIGALHLNPAIVNALSPAARQLFDAGYAAVEKVAGEGLSDLGNAAMSAVATELGPELTNELTGLASTVGSAIGDAVPIVNIMMGIVNIVSGVRDAANAPLVARVNDFFAMGQIQGTSAADLFAPSREATVNGDSWGLYVDRPRSVLGACLAAVTEDNEGEAPLSHFPTSPGFDPASLAFQAAHPEIVVPAPYRWPGYDPLYVQAGACDTNLHHSPCIWDLAANPAWPGRDGPVGIPKSRRMVYRAMRRAMAARVENGPSPGALFLPVYGDMLLEDFDSGALSAPFIGNLLAWAYTDNSDLGPSAYGLEEVAGADQRALISKPGVMGFTREQRTQLVAAVVGFAGSYRNSRAELAKRIGKKIGGPKPLHLDFGKKKASKGGGGGAALVALAALGLVLARGRK